MWGMIATWRMAVEGITEGAEILRNDGDAENAIVKAVSEVEDFPYYKSVGYGGLPNEEMEATADTPKAPTPNDSAYWGRTGVIIPKPIAMMNAAAIRMRISAGILSFSTDADI